MSLDNNLCYLWQEWGLDENGIPESLRLTADALAQIARLQAWAERQVGQLAQAKEQPLSLPRSQPPPPPQPRVPVVDAAPAVSPVAAPARPMWAVPPPPVDPAAIARAAVLKAGPRVGVSPTTVLEM